MKKILVADIMTRGPVVIRPEMNLLECARTMVKKRVGSLILADGKKFRGIITQKDILWALIKKSQKDLSKIKASDISPRKLITVSPTATVENVILKMKKSKFGRLPVVQEGNLVGMITMKDILTFNPEVYPELEELSQIREESEKLKRVKEFQKEGFDDEREGVCEECGEHRALSIVSGVAVCASCRDNMIREED